nr:hypothetical protein [Tanacetum cinerariifolium]
SPPILPIPLPAASPPLQLLSFDRRAERPEVTLPPQKRLSIVHCPGYEAGESSVAAAARPIEGRRADYGFFDSVEAEIRRRRAEVTELAAVQEQDTQDIYGVMEDTHARDANRTGDDSHTSGTGVRRTKRVTRECIYQDFMKCQPLYFNDIEGVVELTQWSPTNANVANNQRGNGAGQKVTCYECRAQGHFKRILEMPLPEVCTVIEEMMKQLPVKDRWQLH